MNHWNEIFRAKMRATDGGASAHDSAAFDPAHDSLHLERVVRTARALCESEGASLEVVLPAAWLHDFVVVPKNDPRRSQASRLSAEAAVLYLSSINYPAQYLEDIAHAIESHSFSAGITPRTLEARVVQDADRLDGLGAVGLARLFITAGLMRRPFYSEEDPFCFVRSPNDAVYTIDHVYKKLFVVADTLQTSAGRAEGLRRRAIIERYLVDLSGEI